MASKVLVPPSPFSKLQVKKSPPEQPSPGFTISTDAAARAAHLEHSIRFLQEQHRLMLGGLHAEVEALRERNRDLQFQLIFNKESSPKVSPQAAEAKTENTEEIRLKQEVTKLEREAAAARGEARAAEARSLQLQGLVDEQAEKLRSLELTSPGAGPPSPDAAGESRSELRARLAEAARLVRRLRGDAERQRREVPRAAAGVTNLLFDDAAVNAAHLHCMKSSLQASLRASGLEPGFGFHNSYHFPPVHTPDFWREPLREEYGGGGRGRRRPLTLPELAPHAHSRATVFANNYTTRPRHNGFENKPKRGSPNVENVNGITPTESPDFVLKATRSKNKSDVSEDPYPELKVVITKLDRIPLGNVTAGGGGDARRPRRQHRKHADQT